MGSYCAHRYAALNRFLLIILTSPTVHGVNRVAGVPWIVVELLAMWAEWIFMALRVCMLAVSWLTESGGSLGV